MDFVSFHPGDLGLSGVSPGSGSGVLPTWSFFSSRPHQRKTLITVHVAVWAGEARACVGQPYVGIHGVCPGAVLAPGWQVCDTVWEEGPCTEDTLHPTHS